MSCKWKAATAALALAFLGTPLFAADPAPQATPPNQSGAPAPQPAGGDQPDATGARVVIRRDGARPGQSPDGGERWTYQVQTLPATGDAPRWALQAIAAGPVPSEPATYLGVSVTMPDGTLRSQLNLAEGTGLVVDWVDDKGPAHDALKLHDVITKLDDQLLVNAEQLVTLVRIHQAGQSVNLSVIRQGQTQTVAVKLTQKEGPSVRAMFNDYYIADRMANMRIVRSPQDADEDLHDRAKMIRRLSLDIRGVMPSEAETQAFVQDKSPDAYEKMLSSLLKGHVATWRVEPQPTKTAPAPKQ